MRSLRSSASVPSSSDVQVQTCRPPAVFVFVLLMCALFTAAAYLSSFALRGLPYMTSAVGGGSPKSRRKGQNQLISVSDKGGGGQNIRKFCGPPIWKPLTTLRVEKKMGNAQRVIEEKCLFGLDYLALVTNVRNVSSYLCLSMGKVTTENKYERTYFMHLSFKLQFSCFFIRLLEVDSAMYVGLHWAQGVDRQ